MSTEEDNPQTETPITFVPAEKMSLDLGGPCARTIKRLAQKDPDFPPLIYINNRIHVTNVAWEAYKRTLISRATKAAPFPTKRTATP